MKGRCQADVLQCDYELDLSTLCTEMEADIEERHEEHVADAGEHTKDV